MKGDAMQLVITVHRGVVTGVLSEYEDVDVLVLDFDNQDEDERRKQEAALAEAERALFTNY